MTTNLTALETAALRNILNSGYGTGENPTVWAWCATGGSVTASKVSGVVASLSKKGFVTCEGCGDEATITITPAGAAALRGVS